MLLSLVNCSSCAGVCDIVDKQCDLVTSVLSNQLLRHAIPWGHVCFLIHAVVRLSVKP